MGWSLSRKAVSAALHFDKETRDVDGETAVVATSLDAGVAEDLEHAADRSGVRSVAHDPAPQMSARTQGLTRRC